MKVVILMMTKPKHHDNRKQYSLDPKGMGPVTSYKWTSG